MKQREKRWRERILLAMLTCSVKKKLLPSPKILRSLGEIVGGNSQVRESANQERLFQGDGKDKWLRFIASAINRSGLPHVISDWKSSRHNEAARLAVASVIRLSRTRVSRNGEMLSERKCIWLFWKKLLNLPEGKSAGGFSFKQVKKISNKTKLLEAPGQESVLLAVKL